MSAEGLITLERVMQDGTKIKALADGGSFRREERIREHLHAAEEQVRQAHDSGASCKDEEVSLKAQKARQRAAQEKKERMDKALRELEKIRKTKSGDGKKEARASMTD